MAIDLDYTRLGNKVGILGGTFDPVQRAHVLIAEEAQRIFSLDSVLFIPTKQNPLKTHAPTASDSQRVRMLEIALENYPCFHISQIELRSEGTGPSFTIDTLRDLKHLLPNESKLYMIIGTDNLAGIHKWKEIEQILELIEHPILIAREFGNYQKFMENTPENLLSYRNDFETGFVQVQPIPFSSSQVRQEISKGTIEDVGSLQPEVASYIHAQKLYE